MNRLLIAIAITGMTIPALAIPTAGGEGEAEGGEHFPPEWNPTDARKSTPKSEIVNGRLAEENEFPEVVHLSVNGAGSCTGTVIDPAGYWVLTAAHCMDETTPQDGIVVSVGQSVINPVQQARSIRWIRNDNWDDNDIASQGKDIAVIELAEPLDVFPMALNDQPMGSSWLDLRVTITGFGITASNKNDGGTKRVAETEIVAIGDLNFPDQGNLADQFLNYNGNQSTCQGDSGGPTIANVGDGYVQIGITSWGGVPCGSSERGKIRVDKYIGWLRARGVPFTTTSGSPPSFVCSRRLDDGQEDSTSIGIVPFEVRCQVDYANREELTEVVWQWGDGNTTTGLDVSHTYDRPGNFSVSMCAGGDRDGNEWNHCVERNGLITSCDIPEAGFEITPVEGLTWEIRNLTNVQTYGCLTNLAWEVYDGSGNLVDEYGGWEPEITFPEPGEYRIVQNIGGFAGTDAAEAVVDVKRRAGSCSSATAPLGLGGFGLLLLVGLVRRRQN